MKLSKRNLPTLLFYFITALALGQVASGPVYIVKPGDTLWDISARFLKNPWLWPKIWEQNKFIENPHIIFPGDPITLPSSVVAPEAVVSKPAPLQPAAAPVSKEKETEEKAPEVAIVPEEEVSKPAAEVVPMAAGIMKTTIPEGKEGEIFYFPQKPYLSYISPRKPTPSGRILGSPESDKTIFAEGDYVYVTFNSDTSQGKVYDVVRIEEEVEHPITGKFVGYKVMKLGTLKATSKEGEVWKGKIEKSYYSIERGDMLIESREKNKEVSVKKNESLLKGYIISSPEWRTVFGEGDVVYIDLGKNQGVKEGNLFLVYKPGKKVYDPLLKKKVSTPIETIGKLVIVDVYDNISVALITKSKKEIHIPENIMADFY